MGFVNGVNLLPATGEFTYGTTQHQGQRNYSGAVLVPVNFYQGLNPVFAPVSTYAGNPPSADITYAISQLQVDFPRCTTVAVVCAWFGNSETAGSCQIYPSTTYINGSFSKWNGSAWVPDNWVVSGLDQGASGLIPISSNAEGAFTYGGTPSDASIVECITYLKAQGYRVVFYPFILMDTDGKAWRGRVSYSPDVSDAATSAVAAFLGSAIPADFTQDFTNKTVSYSGAPTDFTYRRMILHYANLCVMAGGVDLFLIGSELRGLETIRGPGWAAAGTRDGSGNATWDYPFVNGTGGLIQLADDVRGIFDVAGYTKDLSGLHNLVSYAADWSSWMGWQHPGAHPPLPVVDGQWPHLDQLWAHTNIDLVCFDNYLPLSDWTTGDGSLLASGQSNNLDVSNWSAAIPADWPVTSPNECGLGLTGQATIYSKAYLKANIEGGEKFNWYYNDSINLGRGFDPLGSVLQVSLPEGDRLFQGRQRYYPNQQILGNKQLRWWWSNQHFALYDTGDGAGEVPRGPQTEWIRNSKSIVFTEYGFPSIDKCTNQPNLFYDAASSESGTAFWSIWRPADGLTYLPQPNQNLPLLALQAVYEYWFTDMPSNNETVGGVEMIQPVFCSVWNWDARPFPAFPNLASVWGDAGNWQAGNWLNGREPFITPPVPDRNRGKFPGGRGSQGLESVIQAMNDSAAA